MTWIAHYKNKEFLMQFSDNSENLFSDINQEELDIFEVISNTGDTVYVNINTGSINLNDNKLSFCLDTKPRLIYFRRNYIHTNLGSNKQIKEVYEHIGWQTTTNEGKNRKFVLGLYNDRVEVLTE